MKKTAIVLCIVIVVLTVVFCGGTIASAMPLNGDEWDQLFLQTVKQLYPAAEGEGEMVLNANKEKLYDIQLKPLGLVYDFTVNGEEGFAVLLYQDGEIYVGEIYFDALSPYLDLPGKYVYVSQGTYLYCENGMYYNTDGGIVDAETLDMLAEKAFCGTDDQPIITYEVVRYLIRTSFDHGRVGSTFPQQCSVRSDGCGPAAATNLLMYYDRTYPNLLPGEPGYIDESTGEFVYYLDEELNKTVQNYLSGLMININGVTVNHFYQGLFIWCDTYAQLAPQYYNIINDSGKIDKTWLKNAILEGKPVIMFLSQFNLTRIATTEKEGDLIETSLYNVNHVMVAFGYRNIVYTFSDCSQRFDNYAEVATGLYRMKSGFVNINVGIKAENAQYIERFVKSRE